MLLSIIINKKGGIVLVKRFMGIILVFCLVVMMFPISAEAYSGGTFGNGFTWQLSDDGNLTISGTGSMPDFKYTSSDSAPWIPYREKVLSVTINPGVTSIGSSAFMYCTNLKSVSIPEGITVIGDEAFANCSSLNCVLLPKSVVSLGYKAFYYCTDLVTVSLPDGLERIGANAFFSCNNMKTAAIPDSVSYIGEGAFYNCSALKELNIPKRLTCINPSSFESCTGITNVTIPDNVTSIGQGAFWGCESLVEIVIPSNVTTIGDSAFYSCTNLSNITLSEGLEAIGASAFSKCVNLTQIVIPSGVQSIGNSSFYKCSRLANVVIGNGTHLIGKKAFSDCNNLRTVTIPGSTTSIDENAFYGTRLTDVYYSGTQGSWNSIQIKSGNDPLIFATLHIQPTSQFDDVQSEKDFYYKPVYWAFYHNPQITTGTSATTFSPYTTCTRAQVVTFLWRAKGCPEPKSTVNPFEDVKTNDYYYKAVLWANEKGITNGTDSRHFSPNADCTRAHVVTFLWRTEGKPDARGAENPFIDVKTGEYYTTAVLWAVNHKPTQITNGTSATTFSPNEACTRGQVVTFLYRDIGER